VFENTRLAGCLVVFVYLHVKMVLTAGNLHGGAGEAYSLVPGSWQRGGGAGEGGKGDGYS
jgi:hypothetical protein